MLRAALLSIYLLAWAVASGLAVLLLSNYVALILHDQLKLLQDDDWAAYTWPIGCVLGAWFAYRFVERRRFHATCAALGSVLAVLCSILAVHAYRHSQILLGVQGPFSGLGESIQAMVYGVGGSACAVIAMGSLAALARKPSAGRTR